MNSIRKRYADGADKNAKGIETRYTDSWNLEGFEKADPKLTGEYGDPKPFRKVGKFR